MDTVLASHFHDLIVDHGLSALAVLGIGAAVALAGAVFFDRGSRLTAAPFVLGVALLGAGGYELAETFAMSHNHLCHNHHADTCSSEPPDYDHAADHDHWFGGQTAAEDGSERADR